MFGVSGGGDVGQMPSAQAAALAGNGKGIPRGWYTNLRALKPVFRILPFSNYISTLNKEIDRWRKCNGCKSGHREVTHTP
jgi:hypothetical protein